MLYKHDACHTRWLGGIVDGPPTPTLPRRETSQPHHRNINTRYASCSHGCSEDIKHVCECVMKVEYSSRQLAIQFFYRGFSHSVIGAMILRLLIVVLEELNYWWVFE